MFFWKKAKTDELRSNEFETLYKRVVDVEQRVRRLELNEVDMRDKVLRKLQLHRPETENNLKENVLLNEERPMRRKRFGGRNAHG